MNTTEFKKMIDGKSIAVVELRCREYPLKPFIVWEVYCIDYHGNSICEQFGEQLENNNGTAKTYTSLDRAWRAIRSLGFEKVIEVEG